MFDELKEDLSQHGVKMMSPFSSFPYLKQAFTVEEEWAVDPHRVHALVKQGKISSEEGEHFISQGAFELAAAAASSKKLLNLRDAFSGHFFA